MEKRDIMLVTVRKLKKAREKVIVNKKETDMDRMKAEKDQVPLLKKIKIEKSQNQSIEIGRENIHHQARVQSQAHHHPHLILSLLILPHLLQAREDIPTGTSPKRENIVAEEKMRRERNVRRQEGSTEEDITDS